MTLTEIQGNFKAWRESRRHPKERVPQELWQQVASVYSSYPPSVICRRLGLSGQQLKAAMLGGYEANLGGDIYKTCKPSCICQVLKSTIKQWAQGEKRPRGTSLKLLNLIAGLSVLV